MSHRRRTRPHRHGLAAVRFAAVALAACLPAAAAPPQVRSEEAPAAAAVTAQQYERMVARAIDYLQNQGQAEDGSLSSFSGIGVTALATTAMLRHGRPPEDPSVAKALKYLERHIQPDGGIYQTGTLYKNYETCVVLLCLAEANADGRYDEVIARADAFLKGIQWGAPQEKDPSDPAYGGAGYGRHNRPDLSNTSFFVDALVAAGNGPDDEALQRALIFISRCQNLETEHNTTPHATKNPDGGFYYTPAAGGQSMSGETPDGGLRSYGSMTYAGLKSMIYAGVTADDPRVKAATEWIRRHYSLKDNPGMGDSGLYYYYHTFGKTMEALGEDAFRDAQGREHDWRAELIAELAARQREDGSWVNADIRWLEGDANLVTAYALLALSHCRTK